MKHSPSFRLDQLLVCRGLAADDDAAERMIRAGEVRVGGQLADKPSHKTEVDAVIEVKARPKFASRGGVKLEEAFNVFGLNVENLACLDIGSSTGGFTDCLLQHGAARVYAVDVGRGLIHWKLRKDPRVVLMEEVNARYLKPEMIPEPVHFATVDVSFISLTRVLPAVARVLAGSGRIVTLIKPQFEATRGEVSNGGVVRDAGVRGRVLDAVMTFGVSELGLEWLGKCESPLEGPAGNVEFLAYWRKRS